MVPLRAIRHARGLTQLQVAAIAGISLKTLQKVEQGRISGVTGRTLLALAGALRCSVLNLVPAFGRVPPPPPDPWDVRGNLRPRQAPRKSPAPDGHDLPN